MADSATAAPNSATEDKKPVFGPELPPGFVRHDHGGGGTNQQTGNLPNTPPAPTPPPQDSSGKPVKHNFYVPKPYQPKVYAIEGPKMGILFGAGEKSFMDRMKAVPRDAKDVEVFDWPPGSTFEQSQFAGHWQHYDDYLASLETKAEDEVKVSTEEAECEGEKQA